MSEIYLRFAPNCKASEVSGCWIKIPALHLLIRKADNERHISLCKGKNGECRHLRSICNPFLAPIDDPFFAIFAQRSCRVQAHNVTPCRCFGNRKTDELLACKDIGYNSGLELWRAEIEDRGQTDDLPAK